MVDGVWKPSPSGKLRTSINDLPEQLIYGIFGHFSLLELEESGLQFSRKDLLGKIGVSRLQVVMGNYMERQIRTDTLLDLCRVSRSVPRIAQPLLYEFPQGLHFQGRRRSFIQTAAKRPDLAARVRHVVYDQEDKDKKNPHPSLDDLNLYRNAAPGLKITPKRNFLQALYSGDTDAEWVFLFSLLPGLSICAFGAPEIGIPHLYGPSVYSDNQSSKPQEKNTSDPLGSLRTLMLDCNGLDGVLSSEHIRLLLKLPSLEEVRFWKTRSEYGPGHFLPGTSRVQTLRFNSADLTQTFLRGVLRACSELKQVYFRWEAPVHYGIFEKTLKALDLCSPSLDSITLVYSDSCKVWQDAIGNRSVRNPLGSFKVFQNLKKLTIDGVFLTGVPELDWSNVDRRRPISREDVDYGKLADIFPASLEQLEINCEGLTIASAPSSLNDLASAPRLDIKECDFTYLVPFLEEIASNCILNRLPNFRQLELSVLCSPRRRFFHQVETLMAQANIVVKFTGFVEDGTPNLGKPIQDSFAQWHESARRYAKRMTHPKKRVERGGGSKDLYDLPNELLAEIISYFDPFGVMATDTDGQEGPNFTHMIDRLAQFCLASKRFCALARPLLYKEFFDDGDSERRLSYVNTISANPQLAAYVRETSFITFDAMTLADDTLRPANMEGAYDDLLAKAEMIAYLDEGHRMEWLMNILPQRRAIETDAELPILLAQITNLEVLRLHLQADEVRYEVYWTLAFIDQVSKVLRQGKSNASGPTPLGQLRYVWLHLEGLHLNPEELENAVQELLRLPSLRELKIFALEPLRDNVVLPLPLHIPDDGTYEPPKHCPSRSSNLEALELEIPGLGPAVLRHLVDACVALKSFKFTHSQDNETTGVPAVIESLRSHKDSLENLDLNFDLQCTLLPQPIGSLKEFVCLKNIKIDADVFLEHYEHPTFWSNGLFALPPSIETLIIGMTSRFWTTLNKWLQEHIDRLICGEYPNLRSVTLLGMRPQTLRQTEISRSVHLSLLEAGVKFNIDDWDPERFTRDIEEVPPHVLEDADSIATAEYYDSAEDEEDDDDDDDDDDEEEKEEEEEEEENGSDEEFDSEVFNADDHASYVDPDEIPPELNDEQSNPSEVDVEDT